MEEYVVEKVIDRYDSIKKYKADKENLIKPAIVYVFNSINHFNAKIGQFDTMIDGHEISKIPVPEEFKYFVYPSVVRLDVLSYTTRDVLDKDVAFDSKIEEHFEFDLNTYLNSISIIRGLLKKDAKENLVMLDSLKVAKNLMDVIDSASFGGKAQIKSEGYIPVPIDSRIRILYSDSYCLQSRKDAIEEYIKSFML